MPLLLYLILILFLDPALAWVNTNTCLLPSVSSFGNIHHISTLLNLARRHHVKMDDDDSVKNNDNNKNRNQTLQQTTTTTTTTTTTATTLEYCPNFHRHIVREKVDAEPNKSKNNNRGRVLQSFPWLDQALHQYPQAQALPLIWNQVLIAGATKQEEVLIYPRHPPEHVNEDDGKNNKLYIQDYLQTRLSWFPSQVDRLIQLYPSLLEWPFPVLKERIEFWLAPLPPNQTDALKSSSSTTTSTNSWSYWGAAPIDWPVLFHNHGQGAGMSVAQVSHGLLTIPHVLLRVMLLFRDQENHDPNERQQQQQPRQWQWQPHQLVHFYQETPTVVMEMTRRQLSYFLQGASNIDCVTFSYLHWRGWNFVQLYTILQALPAMLQPSSDPDCCHDYHYYDHETTETVTVGQTRRSALSPEWLAFWQVRFQMRPIHIQSMLKTHSRLATYSIPQLERNTQCLSSLFQLDSAQVRTILFQMPSLLGMSSQSWQNQRRFWLLDENGGDGDDGVGFTADQFGQNVVLEHAAILHYSVAGNLQPKLDFFQNRLCLARKQIRAMTLAYPKVWGRSLENHLMPFAQGLVAAIRHSSYEDSDGATMAAADISEAPDPCWENIGQGIVAKAPELLKFNWKRNLEPKVHYLLEQCGRATTRKILLQTPRVLPQSLLKSLQPKVELLKLHGCVSVLDQSPWILLLSLKALEKRIDCSPAGLLLSRGHRDHSAKNETPTQTVSKELIQQQQRRQPKNKSRRSIVCLDHNGRIVQVFSSAVQAAEHAGISRGHMYLVLRMSRRVSKNDSSNQYYTYRWATSDDEFTSGNGNSINAFASSAAKNKAAGMLSLAGSVSDSLVSRAPNNTAFGSVRNPVKTRSKKGTTDNTLSLPPTGSAAPLSVLAKDLMKQMVIVESTTPAAYYTPAPVSQLTLYVTARAYPPMDLLRGRPRSGGMAFYVPQFAREDWRKIVSVLWKGRKLQVMPDGKTMLLGYNYIRPSRPRCGLYAIREALRLARVWADEELSAKGRSGASTVIPITIVTDSNYCFDHLGNTTQVLEWGQAPTKESFVYTGPKPLHAANPDILYPLSRTYFRLVNECRAQVTFQKETLNVLGEYSRIAARRMYDSVK